MGDNDLDTIPTSGKAGPDDSWKRVKSFGRSSVRLEILTMHVVRFPRQVCRVLSLTVAQVEYTLFQ